MASLGVKRRSSGSLTSSERMALVDATALVSPPLVASTARSISATASATSISPAATVRSPKSSISSSSLLSSPTSSTLLPVTKPSDLSGSSIAWGPAITASSYSEMSTSTVAATPEVKSLETPGPLNLQTSPSAMSTRSTNILISTTVIGGVFIIMLLIYAVYKRRQGATYAQILHVKPRAPSTISLTPTPMRDKFTALPIVRQVRYSVHSSKHASTASTSDGMQQKSGVPREIASRFHAQNAYIQNSWKTKPIPLPPLPQGAPSVPEKDTPKTSKFPNGTPATNVSISIKIPQKAQVSVSTRPLNSHRNSHLSSMTTSTSDTDLDSAYCTPRGSLQTQSLLVRDQDRWSWTNSQAPTTPRMYGSSQDDSSPKRQSVPRFRSIVSWVRGQSERIDEERPPIPPTPPLVKSGKPMLKNQASKPILAPVPAPAPAPRKLSKSQRPSGNPAKRSSLGSLLRSSTRPRTLTQEDIQALPKTNTVEMDQR